MPKVILRQLQVEAAVGLLDWEKTQTQFLELSCQLSLDFGKAAESDSITETIDYAQLRESIQAFCLSHRFYLLETLADNLANHLLATFPIADTVWLSVIKPAIFADAEGAGVEMEKVRIK